MPKALIGPLLGSHGATSRSVLVVLPVSGAEPSFSWTAADGICRSGDVHRLEDFEPGAAAVWRFDFELEGISAGEIGYRLEVGGEAVRGAWDGAPASFAFVHETEGSRLRILFGSCADRYRAKERDVEANSAYGAFLEKLLRTHRNEAVHLLVLGGDQVYTDPFFAPGREDDPNVLIGLGPDEVKRRLRATYAGAWTERPGFAELLASVPNLMIWDDHDIYDGYGSYLVSVHGRKLVDKLTDDVFPEAARLFDLLQRRGRLEGLGRSWAFAQGDLVLAGLDARSDRNVGNPEPLRRICAPEALEAFDARVRELLARDPGRRTLLLVLPIPLLHLRYELLRGPFRRTVYKWLGTSTDDLLDNWSSVENLRSEDRMLDLVAGWRNLSDRVVILSGDSHMGSAGTLELPGGRRVCQVTSSGLENDGRTPLHTALDTMDAWYVPQALSLMPGSRRDPWHVFGGARGRYRLVPVKDNAQGFLFAGTARNRAHFNGARNAAILSFEGAPKLRWFSEEGSAGIAPTDWEIPA